MEKLKGVIVDLDGTLLDSMWVWEQIDKEFLGKRGLEVPSDYVEKITPLGFFGAAMYTKERFGFEETPQQLMDEWNNMSAQMYAQEVMLKPHVKEVLEYLHKKEIKITIATASDEALFIPCLKHNGVWEYFHSYSTMSEVERGKGFPDIYELAAKKIQCTPQQVLVFEDIVQGTKGAKMGGFDVVGVYDKHSQHDEEGLKTAADYYIYDWSEAIGIIEQRI